MSPPRIFRFLLAGFIGGVGVRSFLPVPLLVVWLGFLALSLGMIWGVRRSRRIPVWALAGLFFFLGVLRFDYVDQRAGTLQEWYAKEARVEGVIRNDPIRSERAQQFDFGVEKIHGSIVDRPFSILVTTRRYPVYRLGDQLEIEGVLESPVVRTRKDLLAAMAFPHTLTKTAEAKGNPVRIFLSRGKHAFEERIDSLLPEPHAAFLKGLLLGERASLPPDLVENFRITGTSHIVALSGYNITLVGRFFMDFLLAITIPFFAAFWVGVAGIVFFVLLTGASASLVRAGIMGILVLIAAREGRAYQITNALVFTAALMLLQDPHILRFDAGFQLSFLATIGLVYLSPHVEQWLDRLSSRFRPKHLEPIMGRMRQGFPGEQTLVETLSAQLAVLPLLIFLFGRASLVSPLSNLLVLAAVPYSMAVGFAAGVLAFVWQPLGQLVGWVSWVLLEYKIRVIGAFAMIPFASIPVARGALIPVVLFYLFLFFRLWQRSRSMQN